MENHFTIRGYNEATDAVVVVPLDKITHAFGQGIWGEDYLIDLAKQNRDGWLWAFEPYTYEPSGFDGFILKSYGVSLVDVGEQQ